MQSDNFSVNTTNSGALSLREAINEKNVKLFEENIRRALEYNFEFKRVEHSPTFFTKKIKYDKNKEDIEILQNDNTTVTINDKKYTILFNEDFNFSVKNESNEIIGTIESKDSNKEQNLELKGENTTIIVHPYREIEIDGFFRVNIFSVNQFNDGEVSIVYSNIKKEEEKHFKYAIIEAKLSPRKVNDLIKQIRKDSHLLKLFGKKSGVILDFINSKDIKDKKHFNNLKNIKCVVYGIKDSMLCGKDVTQPIDWDLDIKVTNLTKNVTNLTKDVTNLTKDVTNLTKNVTNLTSKVDLIYNYIKKKMEKEEPHSGKGEGEEKVKGKREGEKEEDKSIEKKKIENDQKEEENDKNKGDKKEGKKTKKGKQKEKDEKEQVKDKDEGEEKKKIESKELLGKKHKRQSPRKEWP